MSPWDLIIVGAGPAGTSTALHLAARAPELAGRTLILEKEIFPREKFCAGALGGRGLGLLDALGLPLTVPRLPLRRVELRTPRRALAVEQEGLGVVLRRLEFDHALARAVVARGVALREGARVVGLEPGGVGVRLRLADGERLEARAVVGADGVGSVVRRAAGLSPGSLRASVLELDTAAVEGDPAADQLRFDASRPEIPGYLWDFPTLVDGRALVSRGVYALARPGIEPRAWLEAHLRARGLRLGDHRLKAFGERGFDPREPVARPGLLLVGEAAGIDIATGEGIAQALEWGRLAAEALDHGFRRGDLSFSTWRREALGSRLGGDFLLRWLCYGFWYGGGALQAFTAELLRWNPEIMEIYAEDFSGRGPRASTVLRGALRSIWAVPASGLAALKASRAG